jgi:hypothetical protein
MARAEGNFMPSFAKNKPNSNKHLKIAVQRAFDIGRARRLFAEVEALMREARITSDPRVMLDALRVLALQPANVRELIAQA